MPPKFRGLQIAMYATLPDSPSPFGLGVWFRDYLRPSLVLQRFPLPVFDGCKYPTVVAYCKRPNVGGGNGLATETLH